jgi:hypothetical protein
LMEDARRGWHGVPAIDARYEAGHPRRNFALRWMIMNTSCDYPGVSCAGPFCRLVLTVSLLPFTNLRCSPPLNLLLASATHHHYHTMHTGTCKLAGMSGPQAFYGCTKCLIQGERSLGSRKMIFRGYRRYLNQTDPRRDDVATYGSSEQRDAPPARTTRGIVEASKQLEAASTEKQRKAIARQHGVNAASALVDLPYWDLVEDCCVDLMHSQGNVLRNLFYFLGGSRSPDGGVADEAKETAKPRCALTSLALCSPGGGSDTGSGADTVVMSFLVLAQRARGTGTSETRSSQHDSIDHCQRQR